MKCKIKNLSINYEVLGQGKPVVILHGFTPDHRLMTGCMEPVFKGKDNYMRIYPDLPGMGKSENAAWINNSDDMLEIVIDFIEKIIPGENFLLAGESYGGYLSRGVIHRMPERVDGLFLLCPVVVAKSKDRKVPKHEVITIDDEFITGLSTEEIEGFDSMGVVQNRYTFERYTDEIVCGLKVANKDLLDRIRKSDFEFSFDAEMDQLQFPNPTLILVGRQDSIVGFEDAWNLLRNFPRASFAVLDRAGHNLQIEQPELFTHLTDEWLFRVEESIGINQVNKSKTNKE